jgi:hypothetical protein
VHQFFKQTSDFDRSARGTAVLTRRPHLIWLINVSIASMTRAGNGSSAVARTIIFFGDTRRLCSLQSAEVRSPPGGIQTPRQRGTRGGVDARLNLPESSHTEAGCGARQIRWNRVLRIPCDRGVRLASSTQAESRLKL